MGLATGAPDGVKPAEVLDHLHHRVLHSHPRGMKAPALALQAEDSTCRARARKGGGGTSLECKGVAERI